MRTVFKMSDSIRRTQTEDGGILLDVHHGQIFRLNVVASKILELLEGGLDEAQIASQVSSAYVTNIETVQADVHDFIEVLNKHHILQVRSATRNS
jgi:hypothetical protein